MHELEGRVDVGGYERGLVTVVVVITVDVGRAGHIAAAGAVTIADAVVVVVRIFCVEGQSRRGARSIGDEWTKTAGGTMRVGGSGETKSRSRRRVAIVVRAIVLNEVFVIVVTRLEGEDDTPTAMRVRLYMRWNVHMCRQLALVSRGLRDGANGLGLLLLREIHLMGREKVVRARSCWCLRQVGGCDQVRSTVDATCSLS